MARDAAPRPDEPRILRRWGDKSDVNAYQFRSNMSPSLTLCYDMRRKNLNYKLAQRLFSQLKQIGPNYFGDFYALTPYSLAPKDWMAWQYDRSDAGEGMVQAFRREKCEEAAKTFRLGGLDPAAQYELTDGDVEGTTRASGKDLMEKGLAVAIKDAPGAAVIAYARLAKGRAEEQKPSSQPAALK